MSTQYTSIHSGIDIDKAVSYYKSMEAYGRTILSVPIGENNWIDTPDDKTNGGDSLVVGENPSNYYVKITLSGIYKLGGAPSVYFVDNNGQQWYIDHIFTPLSTNGNFDPTNIQNIYCLSNIKMAGAVVITCNLTDAKTFSAGVMYNINLTNATADNIYENDINKSISGIMITLTPDEPEENKEFVGWDVSSPSSLVIEDNSFIMPEEDVEISAVYQDIASE